MRRRVFIHSSSATLALALAGCGGGGGGSVVSQAGAATGVSDGTGSPQTSAAASIQTSPADSVQAPPSDNSPAGSAQTSPAGSAAGAYPFGSRLNAYAAGIKPSSVTQLQMDTTVRSAYDAWKARSIVDVPSVSGGKAVKFGSSPDYLTVSEGAGYGMLLAVLMAGHDPGARALFDGLLTTVRARPAKGMMQYFGDPAKYLMDWRLKKDGTSSDWNDKGANAMDGDLDIAMALLMAHRQWGSGSGWNYRQEAINTINALKLVDMKPDGATKGLPSADNNRTSDYMIGHFRAFAKATGDGFWNKAVDRAYELINHIQTVYAPGTGLMPDFIINTHTANPEPSKGYIGDGTPTEGFFYANALRNPWRFGSDYVLSGDGRWKDVTNKLVNFIKADCGGDPTRIALGYRLDGSPTERSYPPKATIACLIGGALVDGSHQAFLNSLWDWTAGHISQDYYDSELQLLPMIVASGNWWTP